jgi:hypothetical protein
MPNSNSASDPLNFAQNLWGKMGFSLPGMVTPTFDVDELEKRLTDLKAVEGWLKMNLSMLQLTIQTFEMQCTTLKAVRAIGAIKPEPLTPSPPAGPSAEGNADEPATDAMQSALWPWALMQQIQTQMQQAMEKTTPTPPPAKAAKKTP